MNGLDDMRILLSAFCFGYPFVMAWYWMAGGLLFRWFRERHEPLPDNPPELTDYPMVSILVPCFNEKKQAPETFAAAAQVEYPEFEIVAINDGSSDGTEEWQAAEAELIAARIDRNNSTQQRVQSWWSRLRPKAKRQES